MKFEPLVLLLEENLTGMVRGVNLFVDQMPVDIALGIVMKGSFAGTEIDPEVIGRRRGQFQVVVRSKDHAEGEALIKGAMTLLSMVETQLDGILVKNMRPLTEPITYMLSVGNNFEFSVSFSIIYDIVG